MNKPLGVAILGAGDISRRYIDCLSKLSAFRLIGYAAKNQRAVYDGEFALPQRSAQSLVEDDEVDLIVNLLPPLLHAEWTRAALKAGKHVYSEKPLAHDLASARELMALDQPNHRLACAPATPLGPTQQTVRHMIEGGELGEIVGASGTIIYGGPDLWHHNPAPLFDHAAGPLFDMGVYTIAAFVHWFGSAKRVGAAGRQSDDTRTILSGARAGERFPVNTFTHLIGWIEFDSGVIANITASFDSPGTRASAIEVYGRKASVAIDAKGDMFHSPLMICHRFRQWDSVQTRIKGWREPHWAIGVIDTAEAIVGDTSPRLSAAIAIHILEILVGLDCAAKTSQVITIESRCNPPPALPLGAIDDVYPLTLNRAELSKLNTATIRRNDK
jgi:predicted dehydrogenase